MTAEDGLSCVLTTVTTWPSLIYMNTAAAQVIAAIIAETIGARANDRIVTVPAHEVAEVQQMAADLGATETQVHPPMFGRIAVTIWCN